MRDEGVLLDLEHAIHAALQHLWLGAGLELRLHEVRDIFEWSIRAAGSVADERKPEEVASVPTEDRAQIDRDIHADRTIALCGRHRGADGNDDRRDHQRCHAHTHVLRSAVNRAR